MAADLVAVVSPRGARRAVGGHPWIYRDEVERLDGGAGALVSVRDRSGRFVCWAAASPESVIALRRVSFAREQPTIDGLRRRLLGAIELRAGGTTRRSGAGRWLHADAEGFPGLTIDRYEAHLVIQATTAWADRMQHELVPWLASELNLSSVLSRGDAKGREFERLDAETRQLHGTTPTLCEVEAGGAIRLVDPWSGHKTGLYLDQAENQIAATAWLRGRVLDLFCAEGGFSLPLARSGCQVVAVDSSRPGLERAESAAQSNRCADRIEWIEGDVFEYLAELDRTNERFDGVIVDPPPFARRKQELPGAITGYRELLRRSLRLVRPGGRVLGFSCSFHVSQAQFDQVAGEAAAAVGATAHVLARPGPASDHPECLGFPESRYLKGLLMERRYS